MATTTKTRTNGTSRTSITLPAMDLRTIQITLIGDSPLIMHKWGKKAIREMLDKQMKKAKKGREAKDPEQDYHDSLYHGADYGLEEGTYCAPSIWFKLAAVRAAKSVNMAMTDARAAFRVEGEMVKIEGTPRMREDMVRIGNGIADIRYRGEFPEWRCVLTVRYNAGMVSAEQVVNLFNVAGFGCGVGEWRPSKNGQFGCFHVATEDELE